MRRRLFSAVYAATAFWLVTILLPIVTNLATGSTPPHILKPFHKLYWPLIGFSSIILVTFNITQQLRRRNVSDANIVINPQNRARALKQVQKRIDERLSKSLSRIARIELDLEDSSSLIVRPIHLMVQPVTGDTDERLPYKDITQTFAENAESLLILGTAGSGKTTLLVELAQELHDRALNDTSAGVPVILDLARWAASLPPPPTPPASTAKVSGRADASKTRPTGQIGRLLTSRREGSKFGLLTGTEIDLHDWLLRELTFWYKIPAVVTDIWLSARKLILLLDGLDEVSAGTRDQCVEAINKFQDRYNVPSMAICSRLADYERLKGRLALQGAVRISPLTRVQIEQYLDVAGDRLAGVREALKHDGTLWELLDSPLMLNVMVLAYHDRAASEVALGATLADRRRRLIDAYVTEVTTRRHAPAAKYTISETNRWLAQLAYCASQPYNSMPLRRSWRGWNMRWRQTVPESRVRLVFSAIFPWTVGLICSIVVAGSLSFRFGFVTAVISTVPPLAFQCGYVLLTKPTRRKRYLRAVAYGRLRRNGIITGACVAALDYAACTFALRNDRISGTLAYFVVGGAGLIFFIAVAGLLENKVPPAFIEWLGYIAIACGGLCIYLAYRWHPDLRQLTFAFDVGLISAASCTFLVGVVLLAAHLSDEDRLISRRIDRFAFAIPLLLTALALCGSLARQPQDGSDLVLVSVIGVLSGIVWAVPLALLLLVVVGWVLSPLNLVLAWIDLFPFRLRKFLDYSVDRTILYREGSGYSFIHAIFQEYFLDIHRRMEKSWQSGAHRATDGPQSAVEGSAE